MAAELQQVHEDTDQASLKDVHDESITSTDESTRTSNNLSDITEDESNKGSDNALRIDAKFVKDDSREELSGLISHDAGIPVSMQGNVTSGSEEDEGPVDVTTNTEQSQDGRSDSML